MKKRAQSVKAESGFCGLRHVAAAGENARTKGAQRNFGAAEKEALLRGMCSGFFNT